MNKINFKFLSKPKMVIPVAVIIGIIVIIIGFNYVGKGPKVNIENQDVVHQKLTGNVDLSFSKGGKLESVLVKAGQEVKKGEVLAKISAPDALGVISQTKGALDLAEAQYDSLNSQYKTAKKQQDLLVSNAYNTLLSDGLEGVPDKQTSNYPIISGTYTCGKEGYYELDPYKSSDNDSGYSINFSGLESGIISVKYETPVQLGNCGLQIKWVKSDSYFDDHIKWTIEIPNTRSAKYLINKNAYDLARANREKTLSDLAYNIDNGSEETSVAKAQVNAARGAYQAALGAYENNLIIAPGDGTITSVDENLKVGQVVTANKPVISITLK